VGLVDSTPDAVREHLGRFSRVLPGAVVGLDFDGVLAPIVEDPGAAHIHPEAGEVLAGLAEKVAGIAIITGRPARQVLALGGLDEVGDAIGAAGRTLQVFGQYGNEHWSSSERRIVTPRPPQGLSTLIGDLPRLLRRADAADAWIEEKGLAVGVHTRRLDDADAAFERLLPVLTEAADRAGLTVEPGKAVIEIRSGDMDKGQVVERLVESSGARAFLFAGDDLGDVPAFEAVRRLRDRGLDTLLVCSGSDEESALQPLADLVVRGPEGVLGLLRELTRLAP
jgi:trehalose 6-phosphate phosphatase